VSEFVTLDGVMEAPGGEPSHPHTNWVGELPSDEQGQYKFDEAVEAESLLLGRVTYESSRVRGRRTKGRSPTNELDAQARGVVDAEGPVVECDRACG